MTATAERIERIVEHRAQLDSELSEATAELNALAGAYGRWHRCRGTYSFTHRDTDGKLHFRSGYYLLAAAMDELLDAAKALDISRSRKSRISRLGREWMAALGIQVERVRFEDIDCLGAGVAYWLADASSDVVGMPHEYLNLRGAEARAAFARAHDESYNEYRCASCSNSGRVANDAGEVRPDHVEGVCPASLSRCCGVQQLVRREPLGL